MMNEELIASKNSFSGTGTKIPETSTIHFDDNQVKSMMRRQQEICKIFSKISDVRIYQICLWQLSFQNNNTEQKIKIDELHQRDEYKES